MKRLFSILLSFVLICNITVALAKDDGEYEQRGDFLYYPNTNQIYLYVGDSQDIVIPENTDITRMSAGWLKKYNSIEISNNVIFNHMPVVADKLILDDGIIDIPSYTFYCCFAKEVVFPKTLKSIGDSAFEKSNLSCDIVFPDSLESIGDEAFNETAITSVTMGDNVTSIGDRVFANCFELKELRLSDNLTKLGNAICAGASLKKVNIPRKLDLKDEHRGTFGGLKNWGECEVELNREMSLELFDFLGAFPGWEKYCKSDKLKNYKDGDDWCVIGDTLVGYTGDSEKPTIPDFIKEIHSYAFGNDSLAVMETVVIPPSVKKIDKYAFTGSSIEYLVVPDTVEEIGEGFLSHTYVKELTIEGTPNIDPNALVGCLWLLKSKIHVNPNCKLPATFYSEDLPETEWWIDVPGMPTLRPKQTESPVPTGTVQSTTVPTQKPTATVEPSKTTVPTVKPSETKAPIVETTAPTAKPKKFTVETGNAVMVKVDSTDVVFPDAQPFIDENGRTQVPIRAVSEMLDCKVDWDDTSKTATITKENGDVVKVTLGSDVLTVNNKSSQMDTTAIIKDDRTFIPVRFVAEALGLEVEWLE